MNLNLPSNEALQQSVNDLRWRIILGKYGCVSEQHLVENLIDSVVQDVCAPILENNALKEVESLKCRIRVQLLAGVDAGDIKV